MGNLVAAQNDILLKRYRVKTGLKRGERLMEGEWVTEEFRSCIKKRNQLNREKRNCVGAMKAQKE